MKVTRLSVFVWASVLSVSVAGQVPSHVLTSSEWDTARTKVSPKLIPGYSFSFALEPKQSFAFSGQGGQAVWIVPVTYAATDPGNGKGGGPTQQCGVFSLLADGSTGFAEIYGKREQSFDEDPAIVDCIGVKGVSLLAQPTGQAPLLLLAIEANARYEPGQSDDTTKIFVCQWDPAAKAYVRDRALEGKLTSGKGVEALPKTFAEAKRRLLALPR